MIELIFLAQIISSIDCSFSGGFEKGLKDFHQGSYGADPDKFCYAEPNENRANFLEAYELGRNNSDLFEKVGINSIPKDLAEFKDYAKEARALKIQLDAAKKRELPVASASPTPSPEASATP